MINGIEMLNEMERRCMQGKVLHNKFKSTEEVEEIYSIS